MARRLIRAVFSALTVTVCSFGAVVDAEAQSASVEWLSVDVGEPALAGSSKRSSSGTFTIKAAGEDIWGAADQFHFAFHKLSGDADIRARVDKITAAHAWSKAGVMIRGSLDANAPHALALVSAGKGTGFQRRTQLGGMTTHTDGPASSAPRWVRVVREGDTVTASISSDGSDWTEIGTDVIEFGADVYVGIAVTSHQPTALTTATVSQVAVSQPVAASEPIASVPSSPASGTSTSVTSPTGGSMMTSVTLSNGQLSADIGAPAIAGKTTFSSGKYTITAAGAPSWDSTDQLHYVYQRAAGDIDLVARVTSLTAADNWSRAGVMIRETLDANSPHASAFVSAKNGYAFQRRADIGSRIQNTNGGTGVAPGWVRVVRKGSVVEAFRSSDGRSWTRISSQTLLMNESVYVGIAVTSNKATATTKATVTSFSVKESGASTNQLPVVAMTSPVGGSTFAAPGSVTLSAAASDADGSISSVVFYEGSNMIGRALSAPYSVDTVFDPGTYTVRAIAYDDKGASASSETVSIVGVTPDSPTSPTGPPPTGTSPWTVAFKASADHATLVNSYVLRIYRAGADVTRDAPAATSSLGKPAPGSTGDIMVDRSVFLRGLAPGSYLATVAAVGSGGSTATAAISFTR